MISRFSHAQRALLLTGALGVLVPFLTFEVSVAHAEPSPDERAHGTKLELNSTGSVDAVPDTLTASLTVRATDANAANAQSRTNDAVKKAMAAAATVSDVKAVAGNYAVSEQRSGDTVKGWEARQTVRLSAGDASHLLPLVGRLQGQGVLLDGLDWSLSPEHQKALTKEATRRALTDVQTRAEDAASDLHMRVGSYSEINLESQFGPRPMLMMARMASASAPMSTPEEEKVSVTAHAVVVLTH